MFHGLSLLRKEEKKEQSLTEAQKKHLEYLKKYASSEGNGQPMKKKKKKSAKTTQQTAVRIIDEDVSGFKAVQRHEEDDDELQPVIANPEEARVFERQVEEAKNYFKPKEDGRGWVALSGEEAEPPRQQRARHDSPDLEIPRKPARGAASGQGDLEPARKRRHDSPDLELPRRSRHETLESTEQRRQLHGGQVDTSDMSPPRRRRHDSPDMELPRRPPAASLSGPDDLEPPRRRRHDSPDLDIPRRPAPAAAASRGEDDLEPSRKRANFNPDMDVPRRPQPSASEDIDDLEPPRKRRHDSPDLDVPRRQQAAPGRDAQDLEPPRKGKHDTPERNGFAAPGNQHAGDLEPPRKGRHDSPDLEPPRRGGPPGAAAGAAGQAGRQMADRTGTGLVTAAEMARESERLQKEAQQRRRTAQGKGAETVYRDKASGKIQTAEEFAESRDKKLQAQKKREAADADQFLAWRGGLAQQRKVEERLKTMEEEAAKPFARYTVEDEVDAKHREAVRWGDPMAHLVKKSGGDMLTPVTLGLSSDALEKSGFIIPQEIPPHSWIKRGKAPPENRYGIKPGRHWDGVDRSNGFEAKLFRFQNQRGAEEEEAYAWATADM